MDTLPTLVAMIQQKDQQIQKCNEELRQLEKKCSEEPRQLEKKYNEELRQLEKKIHEEELKNLTLKHELDNRNTDYLRVTKTLHLRSVCEEFEATNPILGDKNNKESRKEKWIKMLKSNDIKSINFKKCLIECEVDLVKVPQIATNLFAKINDAVHKDFRTSNETLRIVKKYFTVDEFDLVQCIVKCYGITAVKIL